MGTPHETAAAFHLALGRNGYADAPAMQAYLASPLAKDGAKFADEAMRASPDHCLPPDLLSALPA